MLTNRWKILCRLQGYLRESRGSVIVLFATAVLAVPVSLISPRFFQILIDDVMVAGQTEKLMIVILGLYGVYLLRLALDSAGLFCGNRLLNRLTYGLRQKLWTKILKTPLRDFEQTDIGDWKMRMTNDVDALGGFTRSQVSEYFSLIFMGLSTMSLMLYSHPLLTMVCLFPVPVLLFCNHKIASGSRKVNEDIRQTDEKYQSFTYNALQMWKDIKINNMESTVISRFSTFRQQLAKLGYRRIRYWLYTEVFNDFKANYLSSAYVFIAGAFFLSAQQITIGGLFLFAEYYGLFVSAIDGINAKNAELKSSVPYYSRVFEILESEDKTEPVLPASFYKQISAEKISFSYDGKNILENASCVIKPGQVTAVIGPSGCGKSTLAKLLSAFYRPDNGRIIYDGTDIGQLCDESIRQLITIAGQEPRLFNMSIRDNLLAAKPDASEQELYRCCDMACIGEFIRTLPDGMDMQIGEQGCKLSGGQRQRIALARVLLRNAKLLLLDEAVSALDIPTENVVMGSLSEKTLLFITHRPSLPALADTVIVMSENGEITTGTRGDLKNNDFYKRMIGGWN
jgi:ABC-type bacteriocin/lantibiotic exporter with double-glycine peptidase domain